MLCDCKMVDDDDFCFLYPQWWDKQVRLNCKLSDELSDVISMDPDGRKDPAAKL